MVVFDVFNGAFSLSLEVVIWLIPVPVIYSLEAPLSKKGQPFSSCPTTITKQYIFMFLKLTDTDGNEAVKVYGLIAISSLSIVCASLRLNSLVV